MGHLGNWVAPDVEQQLLEFLDFSFPQIGAAGCAMKALSGHSRHLCRVLHRSMKGRQIITIVRGSRYTHFDPDRW